MNAAGKGKSVCAGVASGSPAGIGEKRGRIGNGTIIPKWIYYSVN